MELHKVGANTSARVGSDLNFLLNVHERLHAPFQLQGNWSALNHAKVARQAQTETLTGASCSD